jgi:hypothetical protein
MTGEQLLELELIKRLRYRYMRCVDRGLVEELRTCFTQDATASFGESWNFTGCEAIVEFLASRFPVRYSFHEAHHPEIDLDGEQAVGVWTVEVNSYARDGSVQSHSATHYHDTYMKLEGGWRISAIRADPLFARRVAFEDRLASRTVQRPI